MADYTKLLEGAFKIVLSKGDGAIRKIVINKKSGKSGDYYQAEKYTEKQVFHENVDFDSIISSEFDYSAVLNKLFPKNNTHIVSLIKPSAIF